MATIKNILYLDEYKMYSISSQLFGGLTQYLTSLEQRSEDRSEEQSGPPLSGRMMADILSFHTSTEERKFLHDYSYTLFEDALREQGKLLEATNTEFDRITDDSPGLSFVAIRARAIFNDMRAIQSILSQFNTIGRAFAYVTSFEAGVFPPENDPSISKNQARIREATIKKQLYDLAESKGLSMDPDFLDNLGVILEYGFEGNFEIQQQVGPYKVSAILRREYFREPAELIVKKYSRFSEQELVLLGTVAQGLNSDSSKTVGNSDDNLESAISDADEDGRDPGLRAALMSVVEQLHVLETTLGGKEDNEMIIDPIALYREL